MNGIAEVLYTVPFPSSNSLGLNRCRGFGHIHLRGASVECVVTVVTQVFPRYMKRDSELASVDRFVD